MSLNKINLVLDKQVKELEAKGTAKGAEMVIEKVIPAKGEIGPRYIVRGHGDKQFIKMNSNSYLGLSMCKRVIEAEEIAAQKYGVGPGAVRFISGTYDTHITLEERLAKFHGKEAAMLFSSAYVTSLGVLFPLCSADTVYVSDELNHNCIIQAMRLSRPAGKFIYKHNDMKDLEVKLQEAIGVGKRVLLVTDGVFSMRGDYAPFAKIKEIADKYEDKFEEGIITIADDSHGIGAYGETGRGTEEITNTKMDVLVGTLGKAFGVNGGYVVASEKVVRYLRETAPMYIYSNPITNSECAAVLKVLDILESEEGIERLKHLSDMTARFEKGLTDNGFETIAGPHPVTPLMVRDTAKTAAIVKHLTENGVLATGLNFPVVPKGDEEIRFQINGDHTAKDVDTVIEVLKSFKG
ncbi:MAG TPA: aminotransferase class I/II-fold pyridoxal phosphate-dependent enzyme [Bacteroidales bacterium]|jgi:glycine C-acetyltransferase|nr:aminotransferase class I/II-fold pyridoxal phosphate-dependent enzyme [Bacteroidales bacterium]MDD4234734.1 aminotransferase class I/II-fold pyridoxal phosphate-dependent enzyme [Bacteroidales bacterium]MDY0160698.1 aminotransferase class I/II-fold pyridoxal phosphate-dependent enzyme [Bacteroidales bacterium]HRW21244.1 aminotransferase class I/II-fold pyridoxal phosphate-dependent enzyme [Bacteroidales bacterium]HXK81648.1 aminotransferase class I/II-fold pyridoxal phosphate-dependent enzym